jgi:hypothetical protein
MVSFPLVERLEPHGLRARILDATGRFALVELALWASLYPAYLAIRGLTIGDPDQAIAHATRLIDLERRFDLLHENDLQQLVASVVQFFSVYYMVGFAPLLVTVLVWLGTRHRAHYRDLRTLLFVSLGIAVVFYVLYPTAPPGSFRLSVLRTRSAWPGTTPARSPGSASTPTPRSEHARRLEPACRDRRLPRHLEPRVARSFRRPPARDDRDRDGNR